ncbi:MAG: methionyl-tRNA formyltransferase [Bacteroidales bacterium]|nr:methionyl-tRNA formyltransferase [Bacteroidales bacterium]
MDQFPRIVFMGTPDFAVGVLDKLIQNKYHIVVVVTVPDKPAGRGKKVHQSPVKLYALKHHIPLLQPVNLKDPAFINNLLSYDADLQIVVAFRMLPEVIWGIPPMGTFNLHASLLPQYRGAAPINWVLINGEKETGVTTFFLDENIDTGKIIFMEKTSIGDEETAGELHDRLMTIGGDLVMKTINSIEKKSHKLIDQADWVGDGEILKKAPKIKKEDCRINWNNLAEEIVNLIRGLSPYPGAFTELISPTGEKYSLKIYRATFTRKINHSITKEVSTDGKSFMNVVVKDGMVHIERLQISSRKRMNIAEFLNGFAIDNNWTIE